MRSMEHIKRYTTIGTAHDQGKTSGVVASGITAELLGTPTGSHGHHDVSAAVHAGGVRRAGRPQPGHMFDPERVTAVHDWHVDRGAVFEDVGQWKRPRYYPLPGEDMDAAVLRECAAVRGGVGILDGSTLGKIDVQGPDAGEFLDMLYTNLMSTPQGRDDPLRRDVRRRRHGDRRRHRHAAGRRPVPGVHDHRRRRPHPGLDGGMAADRMAAPAGAAHLGDRAVAHLPRRGPEVPRRHRRGVRRSRRQQRRVPVHGVAGHHPRRGARPGRSGQLLR